jgi:hypothetical protein
MKITSKGITAINGACNWAEFATGKDLSIDDVELCFHAGAKMPYVIYLEIDGDAQLAGHGKTFTEAAHDFYNACRAAEEARKEGAK